MALTVFPQTSIIAASAVTLSLLCFLLTFPSNVKTASALICRRGGGLPLHLLHFFRGTAVLPCFNRNKLLQSAFSPVSDDALSSSSIQNRVHQANHARLNLRLHPHGHGDGHGDCANTSPERGPRLPLHSFSGTNTRSQLPHRTRHNHLLAAPPQPQLFKASNRTTPTRHFESMDCQLDCLLYPLFSSIPRT
jgi:hypothetical protein